jgi:tol-pal system protein YbgF
MMGKRNLLRPAMGVAVAGILALAILAPSARAQVFAEPVDKRLDRLEKQLREVRSIVLQAHATGAPVEIKEAGPDPQVVALTSRLDDMDQTLRGVTGQMETLQHDLEVSRKDAATTATQMAALAARLDKLEQQVTALAPPPPPAPGAQPGADNGLAGQAAAEGQGPGPAPPEDPAAAFDQARKLLLDGDYDAAATAFQSYVERFDGSPQAPEARYWLGETKYLQQDYASAAQAYLGAIRGWPHASWAPDAVVKLAQALVQLDKKREACGALAEFDHHYPGAPSAAKARAAAARRKAGCTHSGGG